ncbi:FAD-binding oxidoreductase [Roseivivax sp. CAU 1761]
MPPLDSLQALLGARLSLAPGVLRAHGQNETWYPEHLPDAVAFPESTAEVSAILAFCHAHRWPVVAYGAASSLEAQHLAVSGGLCLDMGRMNRVLALRDADLQVVVQPGLTRLALNSELRATGLFFPIDPGADASLGGMAATRASGTTAVRYGTMAENVLALEAVLADGTVIRTGSAARKSSAGYDLTRLLLGSEGTLAVITELTLRLRGVPEAVVAATCRFADVEAAVNCVIATIQSGLPMARIELLDEMMVRGFNLHSEAGLPERPHLFLEFDGSPAGVVEQAESFRAIAAEFGAEAWRSAARSEERSQIWTMRHRAHYASQALGGPGRQLYVTDVCVPISRLAEAVVTAQRAARARKLAATIVGHVGDGNFHCGVSHAPGAADEVAAVRDFGHVLARLALALGGTISGEHGVGLGKRDLMVEEHGAALGVMRAIKDALDPRGILNPGKLLP